MNNLDHEFFMRRAIELALNVPNVPFGALIVNRDTNEILAEGWNKTSNNPTWHGEIDVINQLVLRQESLDASKLVLYTTAEPCPMCMSAILWAGIGMVVFGTSIKFLQSNGWHQIDIHADEVVRRSPHWSCELLGGVLEKDCNPLFQQSNG